MNYHRESNLRYIVRKLAEEEVVEDKESHEYVI